MNRKAFQLAISTLVLIILGIFLLTALILVLTGGIEKLKTSTEPFLDTTQSTSIKQACSMACDNEDYIIYCCKENYKIDDQEINCRDPRLKIDCGLNCASLQCTPENE